MWNNYSPAITERDFDYAQRLGINQIRLFSAPPGHTKQLQQTSGKISCTSCAPPTGAASASCPSSATAWPMQSEGYPGAEEYAKFYVDTLGNEPGLAFWDVFNEPDYPPTPTNRPASRIAFARHMAGVFRKLDPHTPVTIGFAYEAQHGTIRRTTWMCWCSTTISKRGRRCGSTSKRPDWPAPRRTKQVMDDEMGCVGRANPYDMAIQEHLNDHIGYYLFELMIASGRPRAWGNVHGIFYPDGTIRDPSIPMAVMGLFRNRGPEVVLERPNREGRVTRTISDARRWLAGPDGSWQTGLDIAETAANLLESAQLVPLHELPTRQVESLRRGPEGGPALKTLLEKYVAALQPYDR